MTGLLGTKLEKRSDISSDRSGSLGSYPDSLFTIAHRLKGNAALYGYPELGERAKLVAQLLKAPFKDQDHTVILGSLKTLTANIHEICQNSRNLPKHWQI